MTENLILDAEIKKSGSRFYYLTIPVKYIDKGSVIAGKMYRVRFEEIQHEEKQEK